jgi:hypothetical protein
MSKPPESWRAHRRQEAARLNRFDLYTSVAEAKEIIPLAQSNEQPFDLYAFELFPVLFTKSGERPLELPRDIAVEPPSDAFKALGYDAVSLSRSPLRTVWTHSPLSCNTKATMMGANEYCLFDEFDTAGAAAAQFASDEPEPGPYGIVRVLRAVDRAAQDDGNQRGNT